MNSMNGLGDRVGEKCQVVVSSFASYHIDGGWHGMIMVHVRRFGIDRRDATCGGRWEERSACAKHVPPLQGAVFK